MKQKEHFQKNDGLMDLVGLIFIFIVIHEGKDIEWVSYETM